jgi:hypothetical protein
MCAEQASVATKGKRPRTERRQRERELRKLVRDRQRLSELSPGGSPSHPVTIDSPAVVEVRAASERCPLCDGQLDVEEHAAVDVGGELLREARCRCRQCHAPRSLWFRLGSSAPN